MRPSRVSRLAGFRALVRQYLKGFISPGITCSAAPRPSCLSPTSQTHVQHLKKEPDQKDRLLARRKPLEVSQATTRYARRTRGATNRDAALPAAGFEPARAFAQKLVRPPRLPFSPRRQFSRLRTMAADNAVPPSATEPLGHDSISPSNHVTQETRLWFQILQPLGRPPSGRLD